MPTKFLPLGGGGGFWAFFEGGSGSANFIFMGAGISPNDAPRLCRNEPTRYWQGIVARNVVVLA